MVKINKNITAIVIIIFSCALANSLSFSSEFNQGTFQNTYFNNSLRLFNENISGYYLSPLFDAESPANWTGISWNASLFGELTNYQEENLMYGNILLFHLNNNFSDTSGNSNHGSCTFFNCPTYTQNGKLKGAYSFDGIDDIISANLVYGDNYTVSAWLKPNSLNILEIYGRTIVASSPNSSLFYPIWFLAEGSKFRVYAYSSSSGSYVQSNYNNLSVGKWVHLIVSATKGGEAKIYVNGVLDKSFIAGNQAPNNYLSIGDLRPNRKLAFNGSIDEVVVWNRILTPEEVKEVYSRGIKKLNISIKSCEEVNCINSDWENINYKTPQEINLLEKRYFQYLINFETENSSFSPELYEFTLFYQVPEFDKNNPTIITGGSLGGTKEYDKPGEKIVYYTPRSELIKALVFSLLIVVFIIFVILGLIYLGWRIFR
jgi:hypothetical protein